MSYQGNIWLNYSNQFWGKLILSNQNDTLPVSFATWLLETFLWVYSWQMLQSQTSFKGWNLNWITQRVLSRQDLAKLFKPFFWWNDFCQTKMAHTSSVFYDLAPWEFFVGLSLLNPIRETVAKSTPKGQLLKNVPVFASRCNCSSFEAKCATKAPPRGDPVAARLTWPHFVGFLFVLSDTTEAE